MAPHLRGQCRPSMPSGSRVMPRRRNDVGVPMSNKSSRMLLLSNSAILSLFVIGEVAYSQTEPIPLPEITVTAPSPIRRPPAPRPRQTTVSTGAGRAGAGSDTRHSTIGDAPHRRRSVCDRHRGHERRDPPQPGGTLGDVLLNKAGITGSCFAPGASSRPIIRGLDVNRVGIVENGVGGGGVSDLGEDHFVPDQSVCDQPDRGDPRAGHLALWLAIDRRRRQHDRQPHSRSAALPCQAPLRRPGLIAKATRPPRARRLCVNFETRGAVSTVDKGLEGGVLLDAGGGNFAFHADAFGRKADDYRIPAYPYLFATRPAVQRDAAELVAPVRWGVRGRLVHLRSEALSASRSCKTTPSTVSPASTARTTVPASTRTRPRCSARASGARHRPYRLRSASGSAPPTTSTTRSDLPTLRTSHRRRAPDLHQQGAGGRVETQLAPFDLRFATMTTALGVQAGHQQLTAFGDTPGPFSGLYDPNSNRRVAGYIFNEFKLSDTLKGKSPDASSMST